MEWKPRAPREGINVSKTHPLKEAATLLLGLVLLISGILVVAAWSVDLAVRFIPPEAEAKAVASLDLDHFLEGVIDDERQEDVERLLARLLVHWPDAVYDFEVLVLDADEANAAALPGGYILVTRALLDDVESENELAFVLGHELGHFHNRDHLRRLGRGAVYSLSLSLLFGSAGSLPDFGALAGDLTSKSFDREQELEADRFGLELVNKEYGHIGSSWQFFKRLADEASQLSKAAAYLSTHPASASRIEDLRDYAGQMGWPETGPVEAFEDRRP